MVVSAQKISDIQLMLLAMNNDCSSAIIKNKTLFVYVKKGKTDWYSLRDCAEISGVEKLVVYDFSGETVLKPPFLRK